MEAPIISNYITNGEGKQIGLVVAAKIDGDRYNVDYSVCHRDERFFNKDLARRIAYQRALQARPTRVRKRILDDNVLYFYISMLDRAARYFKGCRPSDKVEWVMKNYVYTKYESGTFTYDSKINEDDARWI